jgi:hypothetical protein
MNDEIPLEAPPVDDEGMEPAAPSPSASPARPAKKPAAQPGKNSNGLPPVGDIQLKKKSGTYNTYTIQLSYGQIECIRQALEKDHATPIADELKALFDYYLQTLPGPGEEEEDVKAREEQAAIANGQAQAATDDDADAAIPMPPGEEDDGITVAGEGPEEEGVDVDDLPEPPGAGGPMGRNLADDDAVGTLLGDDGGGSGGGDPDDFIPAPPRE